MSLNSYLSPMGGKIDMRSIKINKKTLRGFFETCLKAVDTMTDDEELTIEEFGHRVIDIVNNQLPENDKIKKFKIDILDLNVYKRE